MSAEETFKKEILSTLYDQHEEDPFTSPQTDYIVSEAADSVDFDVEESDIDHALSLLDDEYLVDYEPALNSRGSISLTPRGVDQLQSDVGGTFLGSNERYYILSELEELDRDNPRSRLDGESFRDDLDIDADLVDLNIWYMIEKGWIDATMVLNSPPYTALKIDSLGRQELERYRTQADRRATTTERASTSEGRARTDERIGIEELLNRVEGVKLEFKETFLYDVYREQANKDLKEEAVKEICAFANTEGGELVIGVEDETKEVKGLERDLDLMPGGKDEFERQVNQEISDRIGSPFASLFTRVQFEEVGDKELCVVSVDPAPEPMYCDDIFIVRNGSSSVPLDTKDAVDYIDQHWS